MEIDEINVEVHIDNSVNELDISVELQEVVAEFDEHSPHAPPTEAAAGVPPTELSQALGATNNSASFGSTELGMHRTLTSTDIPVSEPIFHPSGISTLYEATQGSVFDIIVEGEGLTISDSEVMRFIEDEGIQGSDFCSTQDETTDLVPPTETAAEVPQAGISPDCDETENSVSFAPTDIGSITLTPTGNSASEAMFHPSGIFVPVATIAGSDETAHGSAFDVLVEGEGIQDSSFSNNHAVDETTEEQIDDISVGGMSLSPSDVLDTPTKDEANNQAVDENAEEDPNDNSAAGLSIPRSPLQRELFSNPFYDFSPSPSSSFSECSDEDSSPMLMLSESEPESPDKTISAAARMIPIHDSPIMSTTAKSTIPSGSVVPSGSAKAATTVYSCVEFLHPRQELLFLQILPTLKSTLQIIWLGFQLHQHLDEE